MSAEYWFAVCFCADAVFKLVTTASVVGNLIAVIEDYSFLRKKTSMQKSTVLLTLHGIDIIIEWNRIRSICNHIKGKISTYLLLIAFFIVDIVLPTIWTDFWRFPFQVEVTSRFCYIHLWHIYLCVWKLGGGEINQYLTLFLCVVMAVIYHSPNATWKVLISVSVCTDAQISPARTSMSRTQLLLWGWSQTFKSRLLQ